MEGYKYRDDLKQRTKQFVLRIIKLYQSLPKTQEAQIIGKQLLRSGTSIGANYRAACRARSNAEFYSKISIVIEEADETMFWLELLWEATIVKQELLQNLYNENEEIVKIMITSRKNSQKK
ncbi:MAG: four helix bundle protein [Bacteroidales bacterium]|jgi:four helix bundle protein|nr:four helix bundle protein [Bacteroidales bacterium]